MDLEISFVPFAKSSYSKRPNGPFHKTVLDCFKTSSILPVPSIPISRIISLSSISSNFLFSPG
jgi:hypothetical protein